MEFKNINPKKILEPDRPVHRKRPALPEDPGETVRRKKISRKKKKLRRNLGCLAVIMTIIAGIVMTVLSYTVFFKTEKITVTPFSLYEGQMIVEKSGLKVGSSLLAVNKKKLSSKISGELPYIEYVNITKKFPNEIVLQPVAAVCTSAFEQDDHTFVLVSDKGRILDTSVTDRPGGTLLVKGVDLSEAKTGKMLKDVSQKDFEIVNALLRGISAVRLEDVNYIDISNPLDIFLVYQSRIKIILGPNQSVEYKLKFAKSLLTDHIGPEETGTIDTTFANQAIFNPSPVDTLGI